MDAVERLAAIEDIRRLKARYFRCVDEKDWAQLAALFAPDAVFDHSRGGSIRNPWTGAWEPPLPAETHSPLWRTVPQRPGYGR